MDTCYKEVIVIRIYLTFLFINKKSDAVEIHWGNYKIGYIPRNFSAQISRILDRDGIIFSEVSKIKEDANIYDKIEIKLTLV